MGTKTMQMLSVEPEPALHLFRSKKNCLFRLFALAQKSVNILDRDRRIIHQDANGQRQTTRVMMLIVSPKALRRMIEVKWKEESNIAMISVLRPTSEKTGES